MGSSFPVNTSLTATLTQPIVSFLTPVNVSDTKVMTFSSHQSRHKIFFEGREK